MRRVVRPDGFVAILCEPIGSYRAETLSAEFRADLEDGINEQIFTDEEYARIFDEAGLVTTRATIDGGSFKAILSGDGAGRVTGLVVPPPAHASSRHPAGMGQLARKIKRHASRLLKRY
jgi:hypothetical protein